MKILAATGNTHKISEFNEILSPLGFFVESVYDSHDLKPIPENGKTFEENAILKAEGVASVINKTVFADDSGLEVDSLNGEPGIHSARYAGENATDLDRINKLLKRLEGHRNRDARFVCVIAVASPSGLIDTAVGIVQGRIALSPSGRHGFGYDPIFIPRGYKRKMAELGSQEKNQISHRFRALHEAFEKGLLTGEL